MGGTHSSKKKKAKISTKTNQTQTNQTQTQNQNQTQTQTQTQTLSQSKIDNAEAINQNNLKDSYGEIKTTAVHEKIQPTVPTLPPPAQNMNIMVALYDYQARSNNDLTFKNGEKFTIIDTSDSNWWLVRNVTSGITGYAPSNYLGKISDEMNNYPWYFGTVRRQEAEQILLANGKPGVYLVRASESEQNAFAISLLDECGVIRNYRIKYSPQKYYFITPSQRFQSVPQLIEHYVAQFQGLAHPLLSTPVKYAPQTAGLGKDTWEIERSSIRMITLLGSGNYGEVWKAMWNEKTVVAVKTLKAGKMTKEEFLREGNIMKNLRHPKLVQLLAICTDGEPIYIVTEFMAHGGLNDYLRKNSRNVPVPVLNQMGMQVAEGMVYLEEMKFVHRDLAARNVLVGNNLVCKVSDFGMAVEVAEIGNLDKNSKIPIKWSAPEAIKNRKFTTQSDVWSFGVLLWEILSLGVAPYSTKTNQETYNYIMQGGRLDKPKYCSERLYALMFSCWHDDPLKRPHFKDILMDMTKIVSDETTTGQLYNDI